MTPVQTKKIRLFLNLAFVAVGILLLSAVASAGEKQTMPTDVMFDKSMDDLRATMDKAQESNDDFIEQNHHLQNQADRLQDELDGLNDQKAELQKEDQGNNGDDLLAKKEKELYEARLRNLTLRLSRFKGDQGRLLKKIKSVEADNQSAQDEIAKLNQDIAQAQSFLAKGHAAPAAAAGPKDDELKKALARSAQHIEDIQKKLASVKGIYQKNNGAKNDLQKNFDQLNAAWVAGQEQLESALSEKIMVNKEMAAVSSGPLQSEDEIRQEITDLQGYRLALTRSLSDLKQAAASVKPSTKLDLNAVLQQLSQQHSLLKQQLAFSGDAGDVVSMSEGQDKNKLLDMKKRLTEEQKALRSKIAIAQKESQRKELADSAGKGIDDAKLKTQLQKSTARVHDLQSQINALHKSGAEVKKSLDMEDQVALLEKDLQVLRAQTNKVDDAQEASIPNVDDESLQKEIAQLKSRRDILAESVNAIHSKYSLKDISAKEPGAKEAQLKEYWNTLMVENKALQEKLLILQMRQDKKPQQDL